MLPSLQLPCSQQLQRFEAGFVKDLCCQTLLPHMTCTGWSWASPNCTRSFCRALQVPEALRLQIFALLIGATCAPHSWPCEERLLEVLNRHLLPAWDTVTGAPGRHPSSFMGKQGMIERAQWVHSSQI